MGRLRISIVTDNDDMELQIFLRDHCDLLFKILTETCEDFGLLQAILSRSRHGRN